MYEVMPKRSGVKRSIYETNYERILPLIRSNKDYQKINIEGFMPLSIERIGHNIYSIAHYYEQNGDLMRDPEMTIKIIPGYSVEALTYQQDNLGIYQEVYPAPGKYYPKLKTELNNFLKIWLCNLKKQGFIRAAQ